jgi:hypothetical protein
MLLPRDRQHVAWATVVPNEFVAPASEIRRGASRTKEIVLSRGWTAIELIAAVSSRESRCGSVLDAKGFGD